VIDEELMPVKYQYRPRDLATYDTVIYIVWMGSGWAISGESDRYVFNNDGKWEYQPMPSSRDEDFYRRCRYQSVKDAVAHLKAHGK
jgi:hypothetical protein